MGFPALQGLTAWTLDWISPATPLSLLAVPRGSCRSLRVSIGPRRDFALLSGQAGRRCAVSPSWASYPRACSRCFDLGPFGLIVSPESAERVTASPSALLETVLPAYRGLVLRIEAGSEDTVWLADQGHGASADCCRVTGERRPSTQEALCTGSANVASLSQRQNARCRVFKHLRLSTPTRFATGA